MSSRLTALVGGLLVLAACGSTEATQAPQPASSSSPATTTLLPPADTRGSTVPSAATVPPPDFTRFIAAVDTALGETSYAGAALTDPEVFIATGQLFCELLDGGANSDDILSEHLEATAAANGGPLTDADAIVTGVVLGASTQVICPQHAG